MSSVPAANANHGNRKPRVVLTWRGLLLTGILTGLVVAVMGVLYDEPLEPVGDLAPEFLPTVPEAENGWEYLRGKWESLPELPPSVVQRRVMKVAAAVDGSSSWDIEDPDLAVAAANGKARLDELEAALVLPYFQIPVPGILDPLSVSWMEKGLRDIDAYQIQLLHEGREIDAVAVTLARVAAVRRMLRSAPTVLHWSGCRNLVRKCLRPLPLLLRTPAPDDEVWCLPLEAELSEDWVTRELVSRCARSELARGRNVALHLPRMDFASGVGGPSKPELLLCFKRNATANRAADGLRRADPFWLGFCDEGTLPSFVSHQSAAGFLASWLTGNHVGISMADDVQNSWKGLDSDSREILFLQRAMLARIALHRWELARDSRPGSLTELVPDFLAAVPVDPWDGALLRWDPARFGGMLYSIGQGLTDDPAEAFNRGRRTESWIDEDVDHPAIRMDLPRPGPSAP